MAIVRPTHCFQLRSLLKVLLIVAGIGAYLCTTQFSAERKAKITCSRGSFDKSFVWQYQYPFEYNKTLNIPWRCENPNSLQNETQTVANFGTNDAAQLFLTASTISALSALVFFYLETALRSCFGVGKILLLLELLFSACAFLVWAVVSLNWMQRIMVMTDVKKEFAICSEEKVSCEASLDYDPTLLQLSFIASVASPLFWLVNSLAVILGCCCPCVN